MAGKDEIFLRRLIETFRIEAAEHIDAVTNGLVELETAPAAERQAELIETLFREIHSMKGAARTVNMAHIEGICRAMESVFSGLKKRELEVGPALLDLLHRALDRLVQVLESGNGEPAPAEQSQLQELARELERIAQGHPPPAGKERPAAPAARAEGRHPPGAAVLASGTTRISDIKLNDLLLQAEEMLVVKMTAAQRAAALRQVSIALADLRKDWARLDQEARAAERLGRRTGGAPVSLARILRHLETQNEMMAGLQHQVTTLAGAVENDRRNLASMVDSLLDSIKTVSMLPFSMLLAQLPKAARDLSQDQGKEVELIISGAEVEIDRRILGELKDPLIHLLRNSIDHGIEQTAVRQQRGKPRLGRITIEILPLEGKMVSMRFADDGAGIDWEKIRIAGLEAGTVSEAEAAALAPERDPSLIFRSGISTSPIITDLSGRGLGLAIVREKVEKLGGRVTCQSEPGAGTSFLLTLPLTLATFRGVLVRVGEHLLAVPSRSMDRVIRFRRVEIRSVENRETIAADGAALPLVPLRAVLELGPGPSTAGAEMVNALVLGAGPERIAFQVDEVLSEQELLLKDLGRQLVRVRNIAGSTILGTGRVVPVLNVSDLMKSAVKTAAAPAARPAARTAAGPAAGRPAVLVVEDSITARTLLRSIIEAAGYAVTTAVDGVDGFTALRTGDFALVVSDVDMPRMNGFELTARIRADQRLAELPVILVTALESREDRERGIDVGADAYIVKSSFDQSNLLEAIRRLL
jgi:two-component system, chemotaxis family, sensor kinase CheA